MEEELFGQNSGDSHSLILCVNTTKPMVGWVFPVNFVLNVVFVDFLRQDLAFAFYPPCYNLDCSSECCGIENLNLDSITQMLVQNVSWGKDDTEATFMISVTFSLLP